MAGSLHADWMSGPRDPDGRLRQRRVARRHVGVDRCQRERVPARRRRQATSTNEPKSPGPRTQPACSSQPAMNSSMMVRAWSPSGVTRNSPAASGIVARVARPWRRRSRMGGCSSGSAPLRRGVRPGFVDARADHGAGSVSRQIAANPVGTRRTRLRSLERPLERHAARELLPRADEAIGDRERCRG